MRIVKDPFTNKMIVSLDEFEMKQFNEKKYFNVTPQNVKVFLEDIYELISNDIEKINKYEENKRNENLFNNK